MINSMESSITFHGDKTLWGPWPWQAEAFPKHSPLPGTTAADFPKQSLPKLSFGGEVLRHCYNFLKHIPKGIMIDETKSRVSWQHQTTSSAEVSKKTFYDSPVNVLAFHAAFSGIWCSSKESQWVTRSHHVRFIPPRLLRDSASTCLKLDLGHAAKKPLLTNSVTTALLTWTSLTWKNDEWRYAWASNDSTNSLKMIKMM